MTFPNAQLFWIHFTDWWYEKNNIEITLSAAQTLYGISDTVPQCLGLSLCMIIVKYYIYTASKNEEDYFFDAFLSILKNKIQIETSKAKAKSSCKNNLLVNFQCILSFFVCLLLLFLFCSF